MLIPVKTREAPESEKRIAKRRFNQLRGRISRFSLDALVNMAAALGRKVRLQLDAA